MKMCELEVNSAKSGRGIDQRFRKCKCYFHLKYFFIIVSSAASTVIIEVNLKEGKEVEVSQSLYLDHCRRTFEMHLD